MPASFINVFLHLGNEHVVKELGHIFNCGNQARELAAVFKLMRKPLELVAVGVRLYFLPKVVFSQSDILVASTDKTTVLLFCFGFRNGTEMGLVLS